MASRFATLTPCSICAHKEAVLCPAYVLCATLSRQRRRYEVKQMWTRQQHFVIVSPCEWNQMNSCLQGLRLPNAGMMVIRPNRSVHQQLVSTARAEADERKVRESA